MRSKEGVLSMSNELSVFRDRSGITPAWIVLSRALRAESRRFNTFERAIAYADRVARPKSQRERITRMMAIYDEADGDIRRSRRGGDDRGAY